ncbi:kinase-like protein [Durotheca rogersii]|uniref:kinase-like protein n=1 Tax=Durotheca rogersii TaxID=419775 RepID=UPI00221E4E1C|nr:kinase-like protein [Durotheca rogersii]KAI5866916.1 kinase-like protein [Durotheca rogersii]
MADRIAAMKQAVDSDALTPRDANAQLPQRVAHSTKAKPAPAAKPTQKEKEAPPQPPAAVHEPPSFDRKDGATYQVGKMLGKGGFAVCYEGYLNKKKYALKIVRSKMPPKMEQKFQTELQIHSKMKQQNIVQFLRAFSFEGCTYLVLELCPNGSLMDMVKRRKGLTEPEVRFYSVQIAGAIKYMHAKGIIHRDLKMGNIFLDRDMNAKIGDFGLAALLVTGRDMQTIRRTTLCGTPNYIAPEILEKGKKGHDHMVDIWSLGIIMFAMLTSKPPFQSSTTDEIYRRAKNRDYEWPKPESSKYISEEAKEIVATMLEEAHLRPDPDAIVQHDFFLSGYVPTVAEITTKLRDCPPDSSQFYAVDQTPRMLAQNLRNLKELCRACEVGAWSSTQMVHKSTWREVALEEKAGLTPIIPLAEGIVYRPYDDVSREMNLVRVPPRQPPQPTSRIENEDTKTQVPPIGLLRAPPQSFAAQQRAQGRPMRPAATTRPTTQEDISAAPSASGIVRSRSRRELPQSSTNSSRNVSLKTDALSSAASSRRIKASEAPASATTQEVRKTVPQKAQDERASVPVMADAPTGSLFGPSERKMMVPGTEPDSVLDRLRRLQSELERALNSRSMAIESKTPAPPSPHIVVKWVDYSNKFGLGYILNDGSVGCVFKSIPGSAKGGKTVTLPPSCILVREAEQHCARRQDPGYADRHQIIPMDQAVQFYENDGEAGLSTVSVAPSQFKISVGPDGAPSKIPVGRDIFDFRKREHLILWKKFANYMMAYGRDQDTTDDTGRVQTPASSASSASSSSSSSSKPPAMPPCDVVTFYQRIGDVGCWVFADGHLQFNFPDHTKIVLDATGTWCHFWHLPQEAAARLSARGELDEDALDERAVLSYPVQTLLNFAGRRAAAAGKSEAAVRPSRRRPEINPMQQGIPAANDFRRKVEFVREVVAEWVANGGLGNCRMEREHRRRWMGARETARSGPSKHVWVTIGARWGDKRFSAVVDPKKPGELGAEVEAKAAAA